MINNNHKKSNCGFAEELVSYLYGETATVENAAFEAHLEKCSVCADELAAFSSVQFSISDWKTEQFAALETPVIEIPYPSPNSEVPNAKESWLVRLQSLFSVSPAWSMAIASAAVLAVAVGIVLFALDSPKGGEVAEKNANIRPIFVPTAEKSSENSNAAQNNLPPAESKTPGEVKLPQPQLAVEPNTKNPRAAKTSNNERPAQKAENRNQPKNADVKRNKNNAVPATVVTEEDEDDTLRLAELFEEIDTKE